MINLKRDLSVLIYMEKSSDSTFFAFVATFLSIVGVVITLLAKRKNKYVMYYTKTSLVIFVIAVIVWIVSIILMFIPIIGWIVNFILWIILLVIWIMSWIYAISGEEKEVPIAGKYAKKINL